MKDTYIKQAQRLLNTIVGGLGNSSKEEQAFTKQFFAKLPVSELSRLAESHAAGIAGSAFRFMQERERNKPKIRLFRPTKAEHGYDSHRPVIELINDDKPFLIDSLTAELSQNGFTIFETIHPIFFASRDERGRLKTLHGEATPGATKESFIHFEISELPEDITAEVIIGRLQRVLEFVSLAVSDWQAIIAKTKACEQELHGCTAYGAEEVGEARAFLQWLTNKNFVFLGYLSVDFENGEQGDASINNASLLGISKLDDIPKKVHSSPHLIDIRKASRRSPVHRPVLMDVVTVKRFNAEGGVIGEHRIYGLFTSAVYYQSTDLIPFVRRKVKHVQELAGFDATSHDGKTLKTILEFLPRDELLQINEEDLHALSLGMLALELRPGVKLFIRRDIPGRYLSCLAFVPKEHFSTGVRLYIQSTLESELRATLENFTTHIGESALARLHIILRTTLETPENPDASRIEAEIATSIMLWSDRLRAAMANTMASDRAERLLRLYGSAFPSTYISRYGVEAALEDIETIERARAAKTIAVDFKPASDRYSLKIFNPNQPKTLSDLLPTLENMGLVTFEEHPFIINPATDTAVRMRDITLAPANGTISDFARAKPLFEEALLAVWQGMVADDRLNALVLTALLTARQIVILRALTAYLKQAGFAPTATTIAQTLSSHPEMATLLVHLFEARFNPATETREHVVVALSNQIEERLATVKSIQDDSILRTLYTTIQAMLRTNYYVPSASVLSFKFASERVPGLPLPKPYAEIFVYSVRVEGIHLRGGKVARGGIRWSDRHDDFRTEVLGLMKAQMVKNAVIVPVGSKGGFVVKKESPTNREAFQKEGVECYKLYLSGLLDITDNIVGGAVTPPSSVVRHDGDDPYLVVAADKGTAKFSDTANSVSKSYGFWLDDAFASGGSAGYDHKEMAITARGGFVSVRRHFREMGIDIDQQSFTCVGIGDMAGDVFGNGMLLAPKMKLVAAFNHAHIFIDPAPDLEASYAERKRLFELPRSSWADYKGFSAGGGVFERAAKTISLSPEAQIALGLSRQDFTPDELIKAILTAPVDLLWNGGIGTYVKAESETHDQVGDRANNNVRVNGAELRAKVVGEGGNLGFTQKGRIEYARTGGRINTDAIDNSGGVDCSDHEVNIKIALARAVSSGKLSLPDRNALLKGMTDEVAKLVLKDNALQTKAISVEEFSAPALLGSHARLIRTLEASGLLKRSIEYLPADAEIAALEHANRGLTRPELAVLLAYSKIALYRAIIDSPLPDDPYFAVDLVRYFPEAMKTNYADEIARHPLKRDIIATVATNSLVNRAGVTFYFDIAEDTGLGVHAIVGAYTLVRDAYSLRTLWEQMEKTSGLSHAQDISMHREIASLLDYVTRRVLRLVPEISDIKASVARFKPAIDALSPNQKQTLEGGILALSSLKYAVDIAVLAERTHADVDKAADVYTATMEELALLSLIEKAVKDAQKSALDRVAIKILVQDISDQLLEIAETVLKEFKGSVHVWAEAKSAKLGAYKHALKDVVSREHLDVAMLTIALDQLRRL